jgi:hypothetical protein
MRPREPEGRGRCFLFTEAKIQNAGCFFRKGLRVFGLAGVASLFGGGPSLRGFDFNRLKGEIVITVNRGFESAPFAAINRGPGSAALGVVMKKGDLGKEARKN